MATATLKKSDGVTVVASTLNPVTIRALVHAGLGTATDNTHTLATLKDAVTDAKFQAATAQNPISLGLELLREVPSFYPEKL